jgi:hypothetical protein
LIAVMQTPHRFRTKRHLWTCSGLGLETYDSAVPRRPRTAADARSGRKKRRMSLQTPKLFSIRRDDEVRETLGGVLTSARLWSRGPRCPSYFLSIRVYSVTTRQIVLSLVEPSETRRNEDG